MNLGTNMVLWDRAGGHPIEDLLASIRHYEEKHGMSTQDFLSKFESGEADDVEDWRQTRKELGEVVG